MPGETVATSEQPKPAIGFLGFLGYSERQVPQRPTDDILPSRIVCGAQEQLADDLDLLAEERASMGDARKAAVYRRRAKSVREGHGDPGWA